MDDRETRPPTLLAVPSYLAGQVARIGHRALVEALNAHGLRMPHFAVLAGLYDFGPLPYHVLADRLRLDRSQVAGHLDDLERRGLARRERDPGDRRRQRAALTPTGQRLVRRLQKIAESSQEEYLAVLSEAERATLIELLRRVVCADDERSASQGR